MDASAEATPPPPEVHWVYDSGSVDRYVAALLQELSNLTEQVADAKQLIERAEQRAAEAEESQVWLKRVLDTVRVDTDTRVAEAERRAREIIAEAQREADELLSAKRIEAQGIIDEAHQAIEAVFTAVRYQSEAIAAVEPEGGQENEPVAAGTSAGLGDADGAKSHWGGGGPWAASPAHDDEAARLAGPGIVAPAREAEAGIVDLAGIEQRHAFANHSDSAPTGGAPVAPSRASYLLGPVNGESMTPGVDTGASPRRNGTVTPASTPPISSAALRAVEAIHEVERSAIVAAGPAPPSQVPDDAADAATEGCETRVQSPTVAATQPDDAVFERVTPMAAAWTPDLATIRGPVEWSPAPAATWTADVAIIRSRIQWSPTPAAAPGVWAPPETAAAPSPEPEASGAVAVPDWPWPEPAAAEADAAEFPATTAPGGPFAPPAAVANWRVRWQVARDGPSPVDDDVYSSAHRLASLEDGTYVDTLREPATPDPADHQSEGDGAPGANTFGARTPPLETTPTITVDSGDGLGLEFLPPPTGPPLIADETFERPPHRIRSRRGRRRTSGEATE